VTSYYFASQQTTQRNPDLSLKAQALHAMILGMPDDWKIWHADLQQRTGWGKDKVNSAIRELVTYGLWVQESERSIRGQCRYRVRERLDVEIPEDPGDQRIFRCRDDEGRLAYGSEDWGYRMQRGWWEVTDLDPTLVWAHQILLGWPSGWQSNVTIKRLAKCFADGENTSRRILATLVEHGLLHRIQGRDDDGAFRWRTVVTVYANKTTNVIDLQAERIVRRPAYVVDQARDILDPTGTEIGSVRIADMPSPRCVRETPAKEENVLPSLTETPVLCLVEAEAPETENGPPAMDQVFDPEESRERVTKKAQYKKVRRQRRKADAHRGRGPRILSADTDPLKEHEIQEVAGPVGTPPGDGRPYEDVRYTPSQAALGSAVHPLSPGGTRMDADTAIGRLRALGERPLWEWTFKGRPGKMSAVHPSHRTPYEIAVYFRCVANDAGLSGTHTGIARNTNILEGWVVDGDLHPWVVCYMIDTYIKEARSRKDEIEDPFMDFVRQSSHLERRARQAFKARQIYTPEQRAIDARAQERLQEHVRQVVAERRLRRSERNQQGG